MLRGHSGNDCEHNVMSTAQFAELDQHNSDCTSKRCGNTVLSLLLCLCSSGKKLIMSWSFVKNVVRNLKARFEDDLLGFSRTFYLLRREDARVHPMIFSHHRLDTEQALEPLLSRRPSPLDHTVYAL